ncbi:hypothetical protein CMUS01_11678 [Colletotrichum musicola]|uniref:Uncharacterized protein n=1 Tax=Colletotrichum musicola TaxID=2175873 RepID=A0A8H6N470_9PEZI|nr:hypothetical protein CMUS01_11678 [Colletotrichum musicola]
MSRSAADGSQPPLASTRYTTYYVHYIVLVRVGDHLMVDSTGRRDGMPSPSGRGIPPGLVIVPGDAAGFSNRAVPIAFQTFAATRQNILRVAGG